MLKTNTLYSKQKKSYLEAWSRGYKDNVLSLPLFNCLKQQEARCLDPPFSNAEEIARSIPIQLKGKNI